MEIKNYTQEEYEGISKEIHEEVENFRTVNKATMIGVRILEDGNRQMEIISSHNDIYQLLDDSLYSTRKNRKKFDSYQLIALLTAGWAAPVNNNSQDQIAPSEHPERIRVKMTLLGNTAQQYSSTLTFSGKDEVMYDYMKAGGSLADEFESFLKGWRADGE
jgi:hypothetical protein